MCAGSGETDIAGPENAVTRLPSPSNKGSVSVEAAMAARRSVRRYRGDPLSLSELGQLLWAAQGVTSARHGFRTIPSAGATYPLEVFVLVGQGTVADLKRGVYHYQPASHALLQHQTQDVRADLASAALDQSFAARAPAVIVICAVYQRTAYRYGRRGERYVHAEVGHAGQNIHLAAAALKLATVVIGAFDDQEVQKILGLDEHVRPIYVMPVGRPA